MNRYFSDRLLGHTGLPLESRPDSAVDRKTTDARLECEERQRLLANLQDAINEAIRAAISYRNANVAL